MHRVNLFNIDGRQMFGYFDNIRYISDLNTPDKELKMTDYITSHLDDYDEEKFINDFRNVIT